MQNKRSLLADAGLLAVAVIWGAGFAATQYAIDAVSYTHLTLPTTERV